MCPNELTPLWLYQIAKWIEKKTGKPQQIVQTSGSKVVYICHDDDPDSIQDMVIIADADIEIKTISWSDEYGIGLNIIHAGNENGSKVHVIFWDTDDEINRSDGKIYTYVEGAINGLLVIYIDEKSIEITFDDIKNMSLL